MYRLVFLLFLTGCASFSPKSLTWARTDGTSVAPEKIDEDKAACSKFAFAPESDPNKPGPRYMSMARPDDNSNEIMKSCMAERGYQPTRR